MEVTEVLRELGGAARWRTLSRYVGWRALQRARRSGVVTCERGVWSLPGTGIDRVLATELGGVRSHTTAAAHWGLALPPDDPPVCLTVDPKSHMRRQPPGVRLGYRRLGRHEVISDVTTPVRTVVDCLRDEPLRVALSVGDSALRIGAIRWKELAAEVGRLRGRGSALARRRAALLDARAANAFESCARAILVDAGMLGFVPQVTVRDPSGSWIGRVDLADDDLRIVIECEGYGTHGGRDAFVGDLVRFTSLVAAGWLPLRFTWEQVMFHPDWVRDRVLATVARPGGAPPPDRRRSRPARPAA